MNLFDRAIISLYMVGVFVVLICLSHENDVLKARVDKLERKPPSSISIKEPPKVRVLQLHYPK